MYQKLLGLLQEQAKNYIHSTERNAFVQEIQEIPVSKNELNDWALRVTKILIEQLPSTTDISDVLLILVGLAASSRVGHTPEVSHLAFIRMYCKTNGIFQEIMAAFSAQSNPKMDTNIQRSMFKAVIRSDLVKALSNLNIDGYTVWPELLQERFINEFIAASCQQSQWSLISESDITSFFYGNIADCKHPYVKASKKLNLNDALLKQIAYDGKLKLVVDSYLGYSSILRSAQLWITRVSPTNAASSEAAQMYHYDLDTVKWLKVFIYLSDVDIDAGPHCALPGTHLPYTKHPTLLSKLYSRLNDEELFAVQSQEPRVFTGKTGTIIIGDTKAYHKGLPVKCGERVLVQLLYSCSNFSLSFGSEKIQNGINL